jgi:HEAT repeat protein
LNKEASPAVPFIAEGLNRTNSEYRRSCALMALEVIPSRPEDCVPPLVEFMEYAELGLRQRAKSVLRKFGPEAVAAGDAAEARVQRQR